MSKESEASTSRPIKEKIIRRARDSSFSVDSGEEELNGLDTDEEEEFLKKEFLKEYDNARSDSLVAMTKGELVRKYIRMENRIDLLDKRLRKMRRRHGIDQRYPIPEEAEPEVARKIRHLREHIECLEEENRRLREENFRLRSARSEEEEKAALSCSGSSTCSSCSGSSSSSDSSSSSSSDEDNEVDNNDDPEDHVIAPDENAQDTGYDSGASGNKSKLGDVSSTSCK